MVSVVEHLLREGTIVEAEGRWQIRGDMAAPRMDVPDSLRRLIEKQYEGLRAEEQHVLEAGSVAGAEFAAAAVAAALGQEIEAVEGWCEGLARKGQFVRASGVEEWPDGTIGGRYSFLHALYQHVVYDRVAAARRLRFHRRIGERKATAYGPQAGEIAGELAAHFESGRDIGKAVRALGQAGENAIGRHAHQEAIRHLTRGLELLPSLPDTPERAQRELTLRVALATPLMAIKGYAAPEVEQTYARAYALCAEVEHTSSATRGSEGSERAPARTVTGRDGGRTSHSLFSVLRGLVSFHHVRAELRAGRAVGERLLRFTEGVEDPLPLVQAHYGQGAILFDLAELAPALSHLERALALYHTQQHEAHVSLYGGYDPGVACLHWSAMTLWFLGYPDQAQRRSDEALRLAQELAHPFSLAWAWHIAAVVHQYRGERQAARECVNVALALAREHGLAFVSALAMLLHGWGLVGQGQAEEGIAGMRAGLSAYQATGAALTLPGYLAMLAAAHARVGQIPEALCLVDEALTVLNRTEERLHEVDLYRLKGEFILRSTVPNPCVEAEAYMRRALEIARRQGAKSLELRAAMSLGRLWQKQGRAEEARRLLEEVYGWFTEGFETRDLRDAEKFLAALGSTIARPADKKIAEPSGAVRTLGASAGVTPPHLWVPGHETAAPPASQPQLSSGPLPASEQVFRKEGEYWTLVFQGDVCRIRDIRGLQYLAHLLRYPQQEVHVLTLVTGGVEPSDAISLAPSAGERRYPQEDAALGFTDAGDVLDTQARAAYKQRLRELHAELEEARGYNDLGRAEKVREEIDFLTQELSLAVGLGGRARKAASVTERARVNVTRALKAAIKKIADAHPSLGQHLARTVKTGTFCSYTPDLPCSWQF
jgi:predicted ATPase